MICKHHGIPYKTVIVERIDPSSDQRLVEGEWTLCPECTPDERIERLGFRVVKTEE